MSDVDVKEINESYFNGSNFEALMRGIHFAVYWMALVQIYTGPKRSRVSKQSMTILITVLFVLSVIHNAAYWAYVRQAFITHGETAQSIADALNSYPPWFTGITSVSDANAVLADCVIIWRTWVVWGRSWLVTVVPIICTMLTTAFSIIAIYQTVTFTTFGAVGVDYATALYSTSLVTTFWCTGAIVWRVISVSRLSPAGGERVGPGLRAYRGIIEIVVESSALYSIATLFALVAYLRSGPASEFASAFWTAITGIAPTLLIARVASGNARPDDTWAETRTEGGGPVGQLSFLRFNRSEQERTRRSYELDDQMRTAHSQPLSTSTRTVGYSDDGTSAVNQHSPKKEQALLDKV